MARRANHEQDLIQDLAIIGLSIFIAIILAKSGGVQTLLISTQSMKIIGAFLAGLFFTSVFTVAPAVVALGTISLSNHLLLVAFVGGLGALLGDFIIFHFLRDHLTEDLITALKSRRRRVTKLLKLKPLRWVLGALGAILVASPLPDELGLALMGLSKMNRFIFALISFSFNALGIYLIGLAARALA